jgi:spermidine synthase
VREVVIAELDEQVVALARRQLRAVHRGALDDARVRIEIGDGMAYVDRSPGQFDLILMDLTDPDTPPARFTSRPRWPACSGRWRLAARWCCTWAAPCSTRPRCARCWVT